MWKRGFWTANPFFLMSKDALFISCDFNLKWWLSGYILSMSHKVLTFTIDISSFHNGLRQPWSLKLVSVLIATLWKVVMKCKTVMFFFPFWVFFSKCSFLRLQNFISPSIKNPVNLIFALVVCICKIHVFNGVIICEMIQSFWNMSPLPHGFFWNFYQWQVCRYHRGMKMLKVLASNSKNFRIYGIF